MSGSQQHDPQNYVVRVTILGARGLRNADFGPGMGKSDPYCTCEIAGKPESKIQTHVVDDDLDPAWNFSKELQGYTEGDQLAFEVWDKDLNKKDDFLGRAALAVPPPPGQFHGEIPLEDAGKGIQAFLSLKVVVIARGSFQFTNAAFEEKVGRLVPDFEVAWTRTFFLEEVTGYSSEVVLKYPFKTRDQHRFNVRKIWKEMVNGVESLVTTLRVVEPGFASTAAFFQTIGNALSALNSQRPGEGGGTPPQVRAGLAGLREDRRPPRLPTVDAELLAGFAAWQQHAAAFWQETKAIESASWATERRMKCLRSALFFAKGVAMLLVSLAGSLARLECELRKAAVVETQGGEAIQAGLALVARAKLDAGSDPDLLAQTKALTSMLHKAAAAREDEVLSKFGRETKGFDREQVVAWLERQPTEDSRFLHVLEVHIFEAGCEAAAAQRRAASLLAAMQALQEVIIPQTGLLQTLFGRRGCRFRTSDHQRPGLG